MVFFYLLSDQEDRQGSWASCYQQIIKAPGPLVIKIESIHTFVIGKVSTKDEVEWLNIF